jgi:hypothetical protein
MKENEYQAQLIVRLKEMFPGCEVLKQDSSLRQGILDLLLLYQDKWAMLEVKASSRARRQPNQEYYVEYFGRMSFAAFIYPENEEDVLSDLQQAFGTRGSSRVS